MKMLFYIFFILFAMARISNTALTDEEAKVEMTKIIMKCMKDVPVEMSELVNLQMLKTPTEKKTKCLLACAYRNEGSMNDKGMIDAAHTAKRAAYIAGDDEKRLARAQKLAEICVKVNEEKVSDGEKGCDRAALFFECVITNSPKFGFKV